MSGTLSPLDILSDLGIDTATLYLPENACFLNEGLCCAYAQLVTQGILTAAEARSLQRIYDLLQRGGALRRARAEFQLSKLRLTRARRLDDAHQEQQLQPLLQLEPVEIAE
jgi:hypothetical protein